MIGQADEFYRLRNVFISECLPRRGYRSVALEQGKISCPVGASPNSVIAVFILSF